MIGIDDFVKTAEAVMNKTSAGNPEPDEQNRLINLAVSEYYEEMYGGYKLFSQMQPVPIAWQSTQGVTDKLGLFLTRPDPVKLDSLGRIALPDDYNHVSSIGVSIFDKKKDSSASPRNVEVDVVPDGKINYRLGSEIVQPDSLKPICTFYEQSTTAYPNGYVQFYPTNAGHVQFNYLRYYKKPNWGYVENAPKEYTYVATGGVNGDSQNIEFGKNALVPLIVKYCSYLGVNLREGQVTGLLTQKDRITPS